MFKKLNKNEKIAFAIIMVVVTLFTVWYNWFRPVKHELTFGLNRPEEQRGAYGTYCDNEVCHVAIYDGAPGKGELLFYYIINADEMGKDDLDAYICLVDRTREEIEEFGYDVSEGSNEEKIYQYTGRYAMYYE